MSSKTDIPQEEETSLFAANCDKVENIALKLIARAEQNTFALAAKLERKGFDSGVVNEVISRLLERNLLNDGRYAELWIRSRLAAGRVQSPKWLLASLARRGINRRSAKEALARTLDPETEYALLSRYIEKLAPLPLPPKTHLRSEGFSVEILEKYFAGI